MPSLSVRQLNIREQRVHFVGIGGIGLSAIARILLAWGVPVSGSDLHASAITADLAALGATIYAGHDAANLGEATAVIISSAIPSTNPEVTAARARGLPVLKRADFIGQMMADRIGIAVAGTHGKTTTTAMIAHVLAELGQDPTCIVGGIVKGWDSNARIGNGPHFCIEADEYDRMFLGLRPRMAIVTHLEMDHPDCYPTLADMCDAFHAFLDQVPQEGKIIACADEPHVEALLQARAAGPTAPAIIRYGLDPGHDWQAIHIVNRVNGGCDFTPVTDGIELPPVSLQLPGTYNVKNALAVLATCQALGLPAADVAETLGRFQGVKRRFDVKAVAQGITIIDDYAHHPTEIVATLRAARQRYPAQRIWAIFQPHTFTRTRALFDQFAHAFADANDVIVLDIYASRERDDLGLRAETLVHAMAHERVQYCATHDDAVDYLLANTSHGDIVITLGAGDGYRIGERLASAL